MLAYPAGSLTEKERGWYFYCVEFQNKEFGHPLNLPSFKGRINPEYHWPPFIQKMFACDLLLRDPSCRVLLDGRNRTGMLSLSVKEGRVTDIVIKEFHSQGIDKLKTLAFPSKAYKAWRGSVILMKKDIPTPLPVAFIEKKRRPFINQSFYLSVFVHEAEEIRFLFRQLPDEELKVLIQTLAHHLATCHKKGILHRDLSDGNILVRKNPDGDDMFFFIDTNRVRLKKRMGLLKRIKNLIRLGIPPSYQRFFLEQYSGTTPVSPFAWNWYRISKKTYTEYTNLKVKLRLRQVIKKLGIQ